MVITITMTLMIDTQVHYDYMLMMMMIMMMIVMVMIVMMMMMMANDAQSKRQNLINSSPNEQLIKLSRQKKHTEFDAVITFLKNNITAIVIIIIFTPIISDNI